MGSPMYGGRYWSYVVTDACDYFHFFSEYTPRDACVEALVDCDE